MSTRHFVTALLLGLSSCSCQDDPQPPGDSQIQDVPGPYDDSWLELLPEGATEPMVDHNGGLGLQLDPTLRDPATAYAGCAALLFGCLDDTQGDYAACVPEVLSCQTDEPWTEAWCCPQTCKDQFGDLLTAGAQEYDAFIEVFVMDTSCIPGLASRSEGAAR